MPLLCENKQYKFADFVLIFMKNKHKKPPVFQAAAQS
jgi:hypothetical protein